jgi:hypothetical protein
LIRRDSTGSTLYLQDGVELHADPVGAKMTTRYYQFAGTTVAMRTADGVSFGRPRGVSPRHHATVASHGWYCSDLQNP